MMASDTGIPVAAQIAPRVRRVVLILPTEGYRTDAFLAAASRLGIEVIVATEESPPLASEMEDHLVVIDLAEPRGSAEKVAALAQRHPIDAVVGVDDRGVLIASHANETLGLAHNPPDAVVATRDKADMRSVFSAWSVPQPDYRIVPAGGDIEQSAAAVGLPCVIKPISLSASTGVIRVDSAKEAVAAATRIRAILAAHGRRVDEPLMVERYVDGAEVALEGLMTAGDLQVLALFDKPDAPSGPYFEETIYLTPSRLGPAQRDSITSATARACRALGLSHGPIHAELRVGAESAGHPAPVWVLEVASRSIGGLCSKVLRFGSGISLEELVLRNALGVGTDLGVGTEGLQRSDPAAGVMMIPIPRSGILAEVSGLDDARDVDGITEVHITAVRGRPIEALPEGGRYLGFIFARGATVDEVDTALRAAHRALRIDITCEPVGSEP